jgi:hypothetical protein
MTLSRKLGLGVFGWLAAVTLLHLWLNVGVFDRRGSPTGPAVRPFRVGFLPVT